MKSKVARVFGAGTSFSDVIPDLRPRIIASIDALEGQGKTHFGLTAPAPIAYLGADPNAEGVIQKFAAEKTIYPSFYAYEAPESTKDVNGFAAVVRPVWAQWKKDYIAALRSKEIRSIVADTGTWTWETLRIARFGKLTQVPPIMYQQVNNEMTRLITMARNYDKNVLWLHKLGDHYIDKIIDGKKIGVKTGKLERKGYKDMGFDVQAVIRLSRDPEDNEFIANVLKSTLNDDLTGMELCGDACNFPVFASMVFGNSPEDWQ